MIERLQQSGRPGSSCPSGRMFTAHVVVDATATASSTRVEDIQQADIWINGGFFVFRRESSTTSSRARNSSRSVRAPDREERADRVPLRGLLGADGHDQGQAAARRARRVGSRARGALRRVTTRPRRADDDPLPLADAARAASTRVLALGCSLRRHRDRLRRDDPRAHARPAGRRGDLGRARRGRRPRDEARASAERFLAAAGRADVERPRLPRRLLPVRGRRDQGGLRGAQGGSTRRSSSRTRARPAPGPPPRLRADLEHVPRPPDPRVRGPEVRRRPRHAERVRPGRTGARRGEGRLVLEAFPTRPRSTGSRRRSSSG